MEAMLHAHRFQQLQLLHDGRAGRLELVRDIVEDRRCWLLRANRPVGRIADVALWFRVRAGWGDAAHPLQGEILDTVDDDGFALLVLEPMPGELFTQALSRCSGPDAIQAITGLATCLEDARRRGWPAGALDRGALWWDGHRARILPSGWMLPRPPKSEARSWTDHRDPHACQLEISDLWTEIEELCRDGAEDETIPWGIELLDHARELRERAVGSVQVDEVPAAVLTAMERAQGTVRCVVIHTSRPETAATRIARRLRADGTRIVELRPHSRVEDESRPSDRAEILLFRDVRRYADFGVSLDRLRKKGWVDGSEMSIFVTREAIEDEALQLLIAGRSQGDGPLLAEWDFEAASVPVVQPGPDASGRVLEALAVVDGVLPAEWLLSAFSWTGQALSDALFTLVERELVEVSYGRHHAAAGLHLLVEVTEPVRVEVDPSRAGEVSGLLASVAGQHPSRGRSLGPQWLYADLLAHVDPLVAGRRLRSLAQRADRAGLGLFVASVYGALIELGSAGGVTREDLCHAAIASSEQYRRHGRLERAHAVLTEVFERYLEEEVDDRVSVPATLLTEVVLSLVQLEMHRSNFSSAETRLTSLLERTKGDLPAEQRARVYLELAWVQLQLGRTRESCRTSELVLRILDAHAWPDLVARAHNQLGFALYKESDYSASVVHYERALKLREQIGDDLAVARTHNNLGLSYRALGQLGEAERSLRESLRLKRVAGDELAVAASLLNLGFVLFDRGRMPVAEESATRCLEIARLHSHPETEAEAYGLLGEIALATGRLDEARHLLQRDLAICESTGHDSERLATLRRLAEVLLRLGAEDDAARHLEDARSLLALQPSRYEASLLDRLEGELLQRSGSIEPAADAFSAAARGFAEVRRHGLQLESLALRGMVEFDAGREDAARATLAEVRDLLSRHEVHQLPEEVEALEHRMSAATPRSRAAGPHTCLEALTEMLAARVESNRPVHDVLGSLRRALSVVEVAWVLPSGVCWRATGDSCHEAPPPPDLLNLPTGGTELTSRQIGEWWVVAAPTGDSGCVGARTQRTLEPAEEQLLRGAAYLLGENVSLRPSRDAHPRAHAETPRVTKELEHGLVGRSPALVHVGRTIQRVADTEVSVLLLGENGTGKELVARALHDGAASRGGEFVAVNCASIPANLLESELFGHERGSFTSAYDQRIGRFEQAAGGTLLLDEIGEMPLEMQAKLLRVLQERTFTRVGGSDSLDADARIIASTNRDLMNEVRRGRFRMDLFYRINVVTIEIPPLRARREDIEVLARHFLAKHASRFGGRVQDISQETLRRLEAYEWPGNVRELENVITNALVFAGSDVLRPEDLPTSVIGGTGSHGTARFEDIVRLLLETEDWSDERPLLPRLETWVVKEMVDRVGNKTKAAKMLGITKPTVYDRLRRFDALYGVTDDDASGFEAESEK